jgi:DNA repair exonuclease SbcCD ATPase subunit
MISSTDDPSATANQAGRPNGGDRAATPAPAEPSSAASIDKVRDILFGNQVREIDRRFARLEERILKETGDLKADVWNRVAALEDFTKPELESLADHVKAEHDDRVESDAGLSREIKESAASLQRRIAALDEQLAKSQRELRQQILEQHQRLSDDIRKKMDEVLASLAQEAQTLRNDKADRATLAALLTEMAMRLTNDFPIPDAEGNA